MSLLIPDEGLAILIFVIVSILLSWIGLAAAVRRFHDTNRSGCCLLLCLIPIFNLFYVFIVLGCLRGTQGENKYGPEPGK